MREAPRGRLVDWKAPVGLVGQCSRRLGHPDYPEGYAKRLSFAVGAVEWPAHPGHISLKTGVLIRLALHRPSVPKLLQSWSYSNMPFIR